MAAARERLVAGVRTQLVRELALSEGSIDRIITLSNLDESLGTLLRRSTA